MLSKYKLFTKEAILKTLSQNRQTTQPIINRLSEIDRELESAIFEKNDLSYLDHIKIQDFHNQIKKIYLKYMPAEFQADVSNLKDEIKALLDKEELDIQKYAVLDYQLKEMLKDVKKPTMITTLDEARVSAFQDRIDEIYTNNEPQLQELIHIEKLFEEKSELLDMI